jgi:uncharacterized protein (TIGR02466 family)
MFAETEAIGLFPTYLWMHQLNPRDRDRVNSAIREKLTSLRANLPSEVPKQGSQTDQNLHTLPEFQELNKFILAATKGIVDFLKIAEESIEITSCWANINPHGATNPWHTHPNNYLGGVYYVDTPADAATIIFQDPRPQSYVVSPRVKQSTAENSGRAIIPVKEGMLLLFPAWLSHSVTANPTAQERISVSFNLMFSSFTEKVSPVKWQGNLPVN